MKDKKKIKIYLQYPWKFPDSPYYKYLIDSPPEGIEFQNTLRQKGVITNKKFFWLSNFMKKNIRKWTNRLNLAIPNAHVSPKGDYDLIHCAHCLSKNKDKPWVADIESWWSMYISGYNSEKTRKKVEEILLSRNCKKILPWTKATQKDILKKFPKIKNKIEVVYPAIPGKKLIRNGNPDKITLIFTGRYFYPKGGLCALEVIGRLTKKYKNVYGIINSEVPESILKKYSKNEKMKFYGLISQEKLFELYERADISIYPGYSDTFGFAYLESMSFGIPILTVNGLAREEIIKERQTGFIIDSELPVEKINRRIIYEGIVSGLCEKASLLIEDKELRKKMSKNCLKEIKSGKFSIEKRNEKMKKIYGEVI